MSGIASVLAKKRALAAGFGSNANAIKYLNQNFESLRTESLSRGQLFCDPTFPARPESLGFNELGPRSSKARGVQWKRPGVIFSSAFSQFFIIYVFDGNHARMRLINVKTHDADQSNITQS